MRFLELRTTDGRCIARRVRMAYSFRSRCIGLIRHRIIPEQEGLLLIPGGSVHTLGMSFSIDVVFLTRQMRVLGLAERVPPWRVRIAPRGTGRVLELAAGQIAATRLTTGTYLIVDSTASTPIDPSDGPTIKLPRPPCERMPIQFSLRLPFERSCRARAVRTLQPYPRELDSRVTTKPSAGT